MPSAGDPTELQRLRVALIGAGEWGWQHARVFRERTDVEICSVAGRTRARTEERAHQLGVCAYTNIREMIERERPDLVSISLPNQAHFAPTLEALEAGAPALLVEKPLVFDLKEADTLLAAAEARGVPFFAINFNHRYARPALMAKAALAAGRLGEVVFVTWRFGGEGSSDHPHANLIETQCHAFDLLEWLCGPIRSIMAEMTEKTGGGYRTLVLALGFASGALGSLVGTYDSSYAYPGTHFMEINGTSGRILIEDTVRRYTFQATGNETAEVWQAGYFNDRDREFHRTFDVHVDALLTALRAGLPPPVHARAGRRALALAHAAVRSFETGTRVLIDPES